MSMSIVELCENVEMPVLGYGTWQAKEEELEETLEIALEAGYRHIDTAHVYENEQVIGKVLNRWFSSGKLKREDIFLVTKLPPAGNHPESVPKYIKKSLELLQVDYVDLYLIHVPFALKEVEGDANARVDTEIDHVSLWKAMEAQVDDGLTKAIGLSNFNKKQMEKILQSANIRPCNLQLEPHAFLQQDELVKFCTENKIVVTVQPLGFFGLEKFIAPFDRTLDLPDALKGTIVDVIAECYDKSVSQILLRHAIQKGVVVIPKSTSAERIKKNIDIFDFSLDETDMRELSFFDRKIRILTFMVLDGIENHPEYPFQEKVKTSM